MSTVGLLSTQQLAQLKVDAEGSFPDTCDILDRNDTRDAVYNQKVTATWTETATGVPCGFEFSPFKFRSREIAIGSETGEILARCRISKDYFDTIKISSRIRLTHRFGELLTTPEIHQVQGWEELGPSAMVLNLQRSAL